jgi:NADPH:quinone reductase-like Zn-dependent oxidoreductase
MQSKPKETLMTVAMRAVRFHAYGEPGDVLRLEQAAVPAPGPGRIRVAVHACGLAPADWALCRGVFPGQLPRGIGCDVSGVVDAVGDGPTYAPRLRELGATVTSYGDGVVQRVKAVSNGPVDLVLDTAPVGGTLPDLVEIAGGDPRRVLTISDIEAAQQLGVRDTFHEDPTHLSHRYEAFPEFAQRAADGTFTVPIARTFPLEDWRAAMEISLAGQARGKLLLVP